MRHLERHKVFNSKKTLKGKNLSITESLTKLHMSKLRAARGGYGFWNVWTVDGKILYRVDDTSDSKPAVYYQWRVFNQSLSYAEKKLVSPEKFCFGLIFVFFMLGFSNGIDSRVSLLSFITNNVTGIQSSKERLKLAQYFKDKIG